MRKIVLIAIVLAIAYVVTHPNILPFQKENTAEKSQNKAELKKLLKELGFKEKVK